MSQLQQDAHKDTLGVSSQPSGLAKLGRAIFILLGPISLLGYLLVHTWLNLTGACYNLVIETTLNRLTSKPIHLPTWAVYALSPLIVLLAPLAGLIQALIGLGRWFAGAVVQLGRWQTGVTAGPLAAALGAFWLLLALWITFACISPATGWRLLGRSMPGVAEYQLASDQQMNLGELPEAMQQRRQYLLSTTPQARTDLEQLLQKTATETRSRELAPDELERAVTHFSAELQDDRLMLLELAAPIQRYIAGLPWYYQLPMQSSDNQGRTGLLIGCLAFAALLLIRWPGMGSLTRNSATGIVQFAVRVGLVLAVVIAAFAGSGPEIEIKAGQAAGVLSALAVIALVYWLTWKASHYLRLPRQYSPFLAMRLLQRKRIAFFSLGAVTLCVAMVLIVVSVMGGFLDMVRDRSHHLMGDLVMDSYSTQGFSYYQKFIDELKTWPEIQAATPVITSFGLLQLPEGKNKPVQVVGINLDGADAVNDFKTNLFYDKWYPGTTTLAEQAQPFYGMDAKGFATLPGELEEALKKSPEWQNLQKNPTEAQRYHRLPSHGFPGPGIYEFNPTSSELDANWVVRPGWGQERLPGIIIGRDLIARRSEAGEYDRVYPYPRPRGFKAYLTLAPFTASGRISQNSGPVTRSFLYADDSRTGVYDVDSSHVYIDFKLLQHMLNMEGGGKRIVRPTTDAVTGEATSEYHPTSSVQPRTSQIQIRIKPGVDIYKAKEKVEAAWRDLTLSVEDSADRNLMRGVETRTWEEAQWTFISAVEKEKVLMLILFSVISMVAIFLILCIFYMIVVEKTRDIGIVKSVGGSSGGVAAIFLSYGAAIGVVGAVCGLTLGAIFVHYINSIQDWLASLHPELRVWKADVYSFDTIPNVVKFDDAMVIGIIAVVAAIVGALVPALIAARKHPVESLRYE